MPGLNRVDARDLLRAIDRVKSLGKFSDHELKQRPGDTSARFQNINQHIQKNKEEWKGNRYDQKPSNDDGLKNLLDGYLNAHSHRVYTPYFDDQDKLCRKYTRVFPPSSVIKADVDASFVSGIHMLRGALKLAECARVDEKYKDQMFEAMNVFQGRMKALSAEYETVKDNPETAKKILKKAAQEANKFNSCLVGVLKEAEIEKPFKGMKLLKNFILKKDRHEEAFCSVIEVPGQGFTFSYAKSMTLDADKSLWGEYKQTDSAGKQAFWVEQLKKKHPGVWLDEFVKANIVALKTIPRAPMTTDTPGPGNAFDNTIFSIDQAGKVKQLSHSVLTSTTEPFSVDDINPIYSSHKGNKEKARLTANTHELLFGTDERLKSMVRTYADKWSLSDAGGEKTEECIIPIFDQNLIADLGPIPGQSDAGKSRTTLKHKAQANEKLMKGVLAKTLYLNINDQEDVRNADEYTSMPENQKRLYRRVKFKVIESNRGINMWAFCTRTDNEGANKLLAVAEEKIKTDLSASHPKDTNVILAYLKSKHRTSISNSEYNEAKRAVDRIIQSLNEGDVNRENYKSLLYSSIELKHVIYQDPLAELVRVIMKNPVFEYLHSLYPTAVGYIINAVISLLIILAITSVMPVSPLILLTALFAHIAIRSSQATPAFGALMLCSAISMPILAAITGTSMLAPVSLAVAVSAIPVVGQIILATVTIGLAVYVGINLVKQWGKERSILSKARCEGELGSAIGVAAPKCASTCDRGLEMLMQRILAQMKSVFDSVPKMDCLSRIKRNFLSMATGTPIAKDKETRAKFSKSAGYVSSHDDKLTRAGDKTMGKQREGGMFKQKRSIFGVELSKLPKRNVILSLDEYKDGGKQILGEGGDDDLKTLPQHGK